MPKITFSHRYQKLGVLGNSAEGKYQATLIAVVHVNLEDLPKYFLDYDTDCGLYQLPKRGKYLLLLFLAVGGLFTTLRADWPPAKHKYYSEHIGKVFDIIFSQSSHGTRH